VLNGELALGRPLSEDEIHDADRQAGADLARDLGVTE
jgi:hypothetical protein